jgi:hypothetical protein
VLPENDLSAFGNPEYPTASGTKKIWKTIFVVETPKLLVVCVKVDELG